MCRPRSCLRRRRLTMSGARGRKQAELPCLQSTTLGACELSSVQHALSVPAGRSRSFTPLQLLAAPPLPAASANCFWPLVPACLHLVTRCEQEVEQQTRGDRSRWDHLANFLQPKHLLVLHAAPARCSHRKTGGIKWSSCIRCCGLNLDIRKHAAATGSCH